MAANAWCRIYPSEPDEDLDQLRTNPGAKNMPRRNSEHVAYFYLMFSISLLKKVVKETNRTPNTNHRLLSPNDTRSKSTYFYNYPEKTIGLQYIKVHNTSCWHTRINSDIGKANAAFYVLVPALHREAKLVALTVSLVSEEQVFRNQRIRYKELEGRLHQLWDQYTEGDITASRLLRDCGNIYGPSND
ncbi:unnamed protein product [Mytilus coruscus]|uniref:Uncharacterized protein n=1 Tax=Mytilus coruscus TaxID=42192 RepID=A0A6J8CLL3_MYTCO|nr:unnamed protein product [Mytilus coruscus]